MAKATKKKRTPAQIAATKRMIAANKARKAGKKAASKSKPKAKAKKAKAASKSSAGSTKGASRNKRASGKGNTGHKAMKKGKRKSRAKQFLKGVGNTAIGGAIGGGSALAIDVAMGYAPLPEKLKTGAGGLAVRAAAAFAVGMGVQKLTKNHQHGRDATVGALACFTRDVGRAVIKDKLPSVQLGELADLSLALGYSSVTEDEIAGLAAMIDGDMDNGRALDNQGGDYDYDMDGVEGLNGDVITFSH